MFGFSRLHRLVTKQDFQSVFASSTKATHKYLLALYRPNQLDYPRLGIIVPKQHVHLAVDRNRARRVIRENFRYRKESLKGLDIIVLIRSKCTPLDNNALRDDLDRVWQKLMPS